MSGPQNINRTYKRYCGGAIASGIFAISLIGVFAAILFMPIFVFAGDGTSPVFVSGLDLIFYAFRDSITKVPYNENPKLLFFDMGLTSYASSGSQNSFFVFISQYHVYLEIVIVAIFGLAAALAIVIAIFGLVYLIAGRNHNTVLVSTLCSSACFSSVMFFGIGFLYFFLCHKMFIEMGANAAMKIHYFSFIFVGIILAITIALNVIYHISFKGKRFIGSVMAARQNAGANFTPQSVNNDLPYMRQNNNQFDQFNQYGGPQGQQFQQAPQYQQPQQVPNDLPNNITEIGENAFAMNTSLRNILIPEGIYYLGPGAFSNCLYLETVVIPRSVQDIGFNCFFNTPNLKKITYLGTMEEFESIPKGSNWLTLSGVSIIDTQNGQLQYDHQ